MEKSFEQIAVILLFVVIILMAGRIFNNWLDYEEKEIRYLSLLDNVTNVTNFLFEGYSSCIYDTTQLNENIKFMNSKDYICNMSKKIEEVCR